MHTVRTLYANVYNVTGLLMAIAKITCIPVRRLKSDINGAPALTTPAVQTAVKVTHATVKVPGPTNELQDGGGKRIRSSPASSFTEILDPRGASKLGRFTLQLDATGMIHHWNPATSACKKANKIGISTRTSNCRHGHMSGSSGFASKKLSKTSPAR